MYSSQLEMTFTISCSTCGGDFRIPDSLFATRFAGREAKIKCKKCGGLILVDGIRNGPARASGRPPAAAGRLPSAARVSRPPGRVSSPPARVLKPPSPARVSNGPLPARVPAPPTPGRSSHPPARPATLSRRRSPLLGAAARRISRPPAAPAPRASSSSEPTSVPPRAAVAAATAPLGRAQDGAPELELVEPGTVGATSEQTSTSSASLRAVEVPRVSEEAELNELRAIAGTEAQAPAMGAEPITPSPPLIAVPAASAAKRGWWVAGVGLALALAVGLAWPARDPAAAGAAATKPVPSEPAPPVLAAPPQEASEVAPTSADPVAPAVPPVPVEAVPAAVESAALAAAASPPVSLAGPSDSDAHNQKALEAALLWGFTNAEECHRGGRPSGTARAILTFGPAGKIIKAELSGEPIASAPVSKCILSYLRSMMIPAFPGPEFTISREITLR